MLCIAACPAAFADPQQLFVKAREQHYLGHYDEQLRLLNQALDEAIKNKNSSDVVVSYEAIGDALHFLNRFDEEVPFRLEAVSVYKNMTNTHDPVLALEYASLACALSGTDRLTQAKQVIDKTLKSLAESKDPNWPLLKAQIFRRIAEAEDNLADQPSAIKHMKEAIEIHRKEWGPDDVAVLDDEEFLSDIYKNTKDIAEAEKILRQVLATRERIFLPQDRSIHHTLVNLHFILSMEHKTAEADAVTARITRFEKESLKSAPQGLKSGANVWVHGYVPPPPLKFDISRPAIVAPGVRPEN